MSEYTHDQKIADAVQILYDGAEIRALRYTAEYREAVYFLVQVGYLKMNPVGGQPLPVSPPSCPVTYPLKPEGSSSESR